MLEPQDRVLLLDLLKPPIDHSLDFAVGTTFSLDLTALLAVPLSLMLLDQMDRFGRIVASRVAAVEAIRRAGSRFAIFCQEGEIVVPPPNRKLLSLLEPNIVSVTPPSGGNFHPKVWLLRFVARDLSVVYRLVCATRNLTFDRCWDTALVLEGPLIDRKNALGANRPLSDFVAALSGFATARVKPDVATRLNQIAEESRRIAFEPPEGFDEIRFWPLGVSPRQVWPFEGRIDRMVVVSPFVSDDCLKRLRSTAADLVLVSRQETIELIDPEVLVELSQVKVFSDEQTDIEAGISTEPDDVDSPATDSRVEELEVSAATPSLTGLHAKLYVADSGGLGRVWTGSANATDAAFRHNVEFLVELTGKKRLCGCDALLEAGGGETRFASFLQDVPPTRSDREPNESHALDQRLREAVSAVCKAGFRMEISTSESGAWSASIFVDHPELVTPLTEVYVRLTLASLNADAHGRSIDFRVPAGTPVAVFDHIDFDALTAFLTICIDVRVGTHWKPKSFTLLVPAAGMPSDRLEKMLLRAIGSRTDFESYLRMMLSVLRQEALSLEHLSALSTEMTTNSDVSQRRTDTESPLFEMLVRALARDPDRIDDLAHTIGQLRQAPGADSAIPPGFIAIWEAILEARKSLVNEARTATI